MKQLASAEFRKSYSNEGDPVEVTSYGKVIGTWFPAGSIGTQPVEAPAPVEEPAAEPEPTRMTIRPGKIRPQMVADTKPILDPNEMRKLERDRYTEFAARMYAPKRQAKTARQD